MNTEDAKAETYLTLVKNIVDKDPLALVSYCRFIGLEEKREDVTEIESR